MNLMKKNSGQVIIIVLLVVTIGLTIGVSLMTRTLQELRSSAVSDSSARAFAAAEAGLEEGLRTLTLRDWTPAQTLTNQATYKYKIAQEGTTGFYPGQIAQDDVVQMGIVKPDGDTTPNPTSLDIYWAGPADPQDTETASLVLTFVYKKAATYGITKISVNGTTRVTNGFINPVETGGIVEQFLRDVNDPQGTTFADKIRISLNTAYFDNGTPYALRIRPVYAKTSVAVLPINSTGNATLPAQYLTISAVGAAGDAQRALEVKKTNPYLPPIFDYVLFNAGSQPLSK